MLTVGDLVKGMSEIAAMPRLPCAVLVQPEGYHELRCRLAEIEPSEPGPFTPQLEVVVSRLWPREGEALLIYDRELLRALTAYEEKRAERAKAGGET